MYLKYKFKIPLRLLPVVVPRRRGLFDVRLPGIFYIVILHILRYALIVGFAIGADGGQRLTRCPPRETKRL